MPDEKSEIEVKREKTAPAPAAARQSPFSMLRGEIDRLFDEFDWPDFRFPFHRRLATVEPMRQLADMWTTSPAIDLVEHDGDYEVQAELPGMKPEDVEVKLSEGMLTIKGEKTSERSEKKEDYHLRERSYGLFQRTFSLPAGIDADKVEASFDNGVLKVRMPKTAEAREKERKIDIKAA